MNLIDPMRLGLSILDSVNRGSSEGRERAFAQIKAAQAGYNRAAQELNDKIKLEQWEFEINTLRPLQLAKMQADVEYSRNRAAAAAAQALRDIVTEDEQLNKEAAMLDEANILMQTIPQLELAQMDLDRLISENEQLASTLQTSSQGDNVDKSAVGAGADGEAVEQTPTANKINQETLAEQRESFLKQKELLNTESARAGARLYSLQQQLLMMANMPTGNNRAAIQQKIATQKQIAQIQNLLTNLRETNPTAFQAYNMRAALPYLDLLETEEQKQRFLYRVSNRQTVLTPEHADFLIKQITKPDATEKQIDTKEQVELLRSYNKTIKDLEIKEISNTLTPQEAYMLKTLRQLRDELVSSLSKRGQLSNETTISPQSFGAPSSATTSSSELDVATSTESATPTTQVEMPKPETLTLEERIARVDSRTPASNVGSGIASAGRAVGSGIVGLMQFQQKESGLSIILSGQLGYEKIVAENTAIEQLIDDYNAGRITRDELDSEINSIIKNTARPYIGIAGQVSLQKFFRARDVIKQLPFTREEIVQITKLSDSKIAEAFRSARKSLSERSRNDINDITVLVNRMLGTKYTSRELVDALLREIGVIK